jgi:NADH-quinone oxidoreductase subunit L
MNALLPLIPLLPLGGFLLTALLGRRYPDDAHRIAIWAVVASWLVASLVALMTLVHIAPFGPQGSGITLWSWIPAIGFRADMGLFADPLTACLLIVVTTIGMLVHVYSIG